MHVVVPQIKDPTFKKHLMNYFETQPFEGRSKSYTWKNSVEGLDLPETASASAAALH